MALTLGTNVGFVSTAPTADPAGSDTTIDGSSVVVKDISPAGARKITEIGWYRGSGTNTANFEIALYSEASGVADARLYVDDTNSSSAGGWITVAVDWEIQPNTAYWIGLQMDAHTGSSTVDSATSGGLGIDVRTSQTTLNNPYGGGAVSDADGMYAIYALYQKSPTVALNSPADASSDSDTTPTFDFTGTDPESNDIRYQLQVATGNFDIGIDTKANSGVIASDDSYSFNITIASNSKRYLIVTVSCRDNDNPTNRPVTGITADGVAMTLLNSRSMTDGDGDDTRSEIWGLPNPNTGTIAIAVTHTGVVDHAGATALSLYNAKLHNTPNATGFDEDTQSTATTDPLTNLTTTVPNCLIIDAAYHQDGNNLTAGSGQTVIEQLGTNGGGDRAISSYKYANIIGTNTMGWTASAKDAFVQVAVAIESAGYVSRRVLTSGVDTTDDADSTTASIIPSANALVIIDVESKTEITADPNQPTATGCGLTWVVVDSIVTDPTSSSRRRITRLRGMGSSPSSGAITIDFGGQTQTTKAWVVEELYDTDTSGTNGSGAFVQTGKENQTDEEGAVTSLSVTLSAFSNLNNAVHAMSGQGNGSTAVTAGSGFTLGGNATDSGENNIEVNTEFRNDNDTTADFSYSPADSGMGIIASEIKAAVQIVLNKVSGTDTGFANPDTGGDTDPFNSGENIQFTVQGGDALAAGTYYWRVRAIDPTGSNLYGPWSNMRSFTVTSGGGSEYTQGCDEVITIVDAVIRTPSRAFSEVVTIVDTMVKTASRSLGEVVTIVDSLTKLPGKALAEVVTIVDTVNNVTSRALSEVITIVDTLSNQAGKVLAETITIVDTVYAAITARMLSEVITIVDTVNRSISRALVDVVQIVDIVNSATSRAFSEVITLVDSISNMAGKGLSETIVIVDTIIRTVTKVLTDVITIVDSIARTISRSYSEVITLVDSLVKDVSRLLSEVITIVDTIVNQLIFNRVLTEIITIVDSVSFTKVYNRALEEVINLTDSLEFLFNSIVGGILKLLANPLRSIGGLFPGGIFHQVNQGTGGVREVNQPTGGVGEISKPTGITGSGDKPQAV